MFQQHWTGRNSLDIAWAIARQEVLVLRGFQTALMYRHLTLRRQLRCLSQT